MQTEKFICDLKLKLYDTYTWQRKVRARFKKFRIILGIGCISTIVMVRLVEKLHPEKYAVMKWHTQAGNITTNLNNEVDFNLHILSMMNVVTW